LPGGAGLAVAVGAAGHGVGSERDPFEQPAREPRPARLVGVDRHRRTARTRDDRPVVEQRGPEPLFGAAAHDDVGVEG
jgi:hypothetical protein